ncbi:MAG: DNA polymerase I [Bacilli bacterium]|nr:DNA polymerase I [Bacilli bacterium]
MRKTYIIDGNSLLFRAFYALFRPGVPVMRSSKGVPTNALYGYRNMMKKIKSELKPGDKMIVCFDTGKKTFRSAKLESYKMNRKPAEPELKEQMPLARTLLDAMGIFHCEEEGYEGDDLAGSLAFYALNQGDQVTLFTSDKDFLQLLKPGIEINFLRKGLSDIQLFTVDNVHEQMGYQADQVVDYKGLVGDPSDNIPGVKGIGEKTACKLLDTYPHLEEIFTGLANDKSKTAQNILQNKDTALFCREIATIKTDVDVKAFYEQGDLKEAEVDVLLSFYKEYDLLKFYHELVQEEDEKNSLFQSGEEQAPELKKNESDFSGFQKVDSFKDLGFIPLSLVAAASETNFHKGKILGFYFSDGKKVCFIPADKLKEDKDFLSFLTSDSKKMTYDLKSLEIALNRMGIIKPKNFDFDLQLATYLLDNDVGSSLDDCLAFYQKDVSAYDQENKNAYLAFILPSLKNSVLASLKEDEEDVLFKDTEMPLAEVLAEMEIEGFPLDKDELSKINDQYQAHLNLITQEIYKIIGREINLNSPKQISSLIYDELQLKKKGKNNSTDVSVLLSIADRHPVVPLLIEYRKYQKIVSSYTSSLADYVYPDGKIHALYNQAVTSTGRLSMSEPNLQNISIRDEDGKEIRKAFFYPNKEYQFLSLDYSQIELRVLASIAHIKDLLNVFNNGEDIHTSTAARVFHVSAAEVTPLMRRKAKAVNFGIVYGISPWGLAEQIKTSPTEASEIIASFYQSYPGLKEYEQKTIQFAHEHGYVTTLLNRRRYLAGINSDNHNVLAFSERAGVNATIQGSAADLIKVAMIKIQKMLENYKTKMILQIHDELIFKVPKEEVGMIDKKIEEIMEHALPLECVLIAEGSYGETWFDCK